MMAHRLCAQWPGRAGVQILEHRDGRIQHDVATLQQGHEVGECRRVELELLQLVGRDRVAILAARVLHVGEEVQHDEVQVLYLVGAGLDELLRAHERGHVTADAQPARVRHVGNGPHQRRRKRRIDLDLLVAMVGVPVDRGLRLGHGLDAHVGRPGERAGAFDDAGQHHARAELGADVEALDAGHERHVVVGHVARAGDAGDEVEGAVHAGEVLVHVPQARHQEAAGRVDHLGAGRRRAGVVGVDAHDVFALHQHAHVVAHDHVARVEQARVADHQRAGGLVRQATRRVGAPGLVGSVLRRLQLRQLRLQRVAQHLEPVVDHGGGGAGLVQPHRHRRELDATDAVQRQHVAGDGHRGAALQPGLAGRQHAQALAGRLQERAGQHAHEFRRCVGGQVERARRVPRDGTGLDAVLPARLAGRHVEVLGERHLPVVVALGVVGDGQPLRIE